MKTTLSLSTKQSTSSSICKSCKRELPLESFYMNKKTQSPDKYCKECRKSLSRRQYGSGKKLPHCSLSGGRVSYPVITQTEDRETRLRLILHALEVVRLSMERKRRECRKNPCCKSGFFILSIYQKTELLWQE